jgi:hypothetical protein
VIGAGLRRAGALATIVALVASACLTDAPLPTPEPTPSLKPEATATVTSYRLGTIAWYAGLVLTFGTATATIDEKGGPVAVDLSLTNPGDVDATLDGPLVLASPESSVEPTRETEIPLVPAGGTVTAALTFDVGPGFDVPAAAIVVGRTIEHQAIVPLSDAAAEAVSLAPLAAELLVEGVAGTLFVELLGTELRADLPDWNQELPRTTMALTLTYNATFRSEFSGGFAFTAENVGLRLPDGSVVKPRRDGHSQSVLIIAPGNRGVGLQSRFEVPSPGSGAYALLIIDGTASKDLPFEIVLP